jgi:tRNA nucleotidyltransferase (CCA-adding enzyme)
MQTYLVGGAVRDALLGLPVKERDWVVVGATPQEMERGGYRLVGRDFPVFLHPQTQEEHALARTERKTGPGYRGFETRFSAYGGQRDLEARLLRHVSPAFAEDPVRILRVARFAARYLGLGFHVAPETLDLMRAMVVAGEAAALVPERVWTETAKALTEASPQVYFEVLRECGALAVVFPEVDRLFGIPQPARWHPEIDTGDHVMRVLAAAARLSPLPRVRFAALVHDLGKGETPREVWPQHIGHEVRSVALIEALAERLRLPNDVRELALLVARHHGVCHRALELRPTTVLELLEHCDAFRRPERYAEFLLACEADMRGRAGFADRPYPQGAFLRRAHAAAQATTLAPAARAGLDGAAIGAAIRTARVAAIAALEREAPTASP